MLIWDVGLLWMREDKMIKDFTTTVGEGVEAINVAMKNLNIIDIQIVAIYETEDGCGDIGYHVLYKDYS